MNNIENRLNELGEELPAAPPPVACYRPFVTSGDLINLSGQLPFDKDGRLAVTGRLGAEIDIETGRKAARLCAINLLSQLRVALNGDWNLLERVVKLGGFVNSVPEFNDQPSVVNGASEFLLDVMGERGLHARTAVGVCSLPLGAAVEVDAIFQVKRTGSNH